MGTEPLGIVLIFGTAVGTADGTDGGGGGGGGGGGASGTDPLFEAVLEGTGFLAGAIFFEFF